MHDLAAAGRRPDPGPLRTGPPRPGVARPWSARRVAPPSRQHEAHRSRYHHVTTVRRLHDLHDDGQARATGSCCDTPRGSARAQATRALRSGQCPLKFGRPRPSKRLSTGSRCSAPGTPPVSACAGKTMLNGCCVVAPPHWVAQSQPGAVRARIRHPRRGLTGRTKGPRRNQGPDGRRPRNIMCMAWGRPGHDMGHVMATARRGHWRPCPGDNRRAAPGRWSRRPR